jgi:hypothetical protein
VSEKTKASNRFQRSTQQWAGFFTNNLSDNLYSELNGKYDYQTKDDFFRKSESAVWQISWKFNNWKNNYDILDPIIVYFK